MDAPARTGVRGPSPRRERRRRNVLISFSVYLFSLKAMARKLSMMWATSISQGHLVVQVSQVAQSQIALEAMTVLPHPHLDEAHDPAYGIVEELRRRGIPPCSCRTGSRERAGPGRSPS